MEKDYTSHFSKGDLLILHLDDDSCVHLLVVHILKEDRVFYCWDRTNQTYRLIYNTPKLHMLCPDFDPNYPSDIATCSFDATGTTSIGKYYFNHSFMMPGVIGVTTACGIGYVLASIII